MGVLCVQVVGKKSEAGTDAPGRTWRPRLSGSNCNSIRSCGFRRHGRDRSNLAERYPPSWSSPDGFQATSDRVVDYHRPRCTWTAAFFCASAGQSASPRDSGYGILGQIHSTEFHEKWILHRAGHEAEFLQAPESTTLANFRKSYQEIAELKPFPADMGALYDLAAAVAIPALPVILAQIPLKVVVMDLLKTLR
jgi:hypothetical protein